jgi:S1-C subfamily serine protease
MFVKNGLLALLLACSMIFLCLGTLADNRSADAGLPDLKVLEKLGYSISNTEGQNEGIGYSDLEDLINACEAYSKGLDVLPSFHEPILTRGESGISVYRKVSPSVVMVVVANMKEGKVTDSALGTGVIIDPTGYVLTNWHVINGFESGVIFLKPANRTEPDENSAYGINIVAESEQSDLALLKIIKPPAGLPAVRLGNASLIQVAEDIHIIGHPHGQLWSYSTGVVSQIRNNYDWQYSDGSGHRANVLQMQTAINPGNSGGPVLDDNGNMLGLVAMSEEGQNLDYAVEIDVIRSFVNNALAQRSRGGQLRTAAGKGQRFVGNTENGQSVLKIVYSNLVSYTVRGSSGAPLEQFAETSDGAILSGSNPNAFGGFSKWEFRTPSGRIVSVNSSGIAPDLISSGHVQ